MRNHEARIVSFICYRCARIRGGSMADDHLATFHKGHCDVCGEIAIVTEPRDYRLKTEEVVPE